MRRIACKSVDSEIKTRFIEVCDGCGKTLVDEDVNPDKYNYYRLTGGEITCDKDQDLVYRYHEISQLDICEDCKNAIESILSTFIKSRRKENDEQAWRSLLL